MVGRERDADYYHEGEQGGVEERPVVLTVDGLAEKRVFGPVSFEVREGEILGIGGLLDSGKSALGRAIAGLVRADLGTVRINNEPARRPEFRRLMAEGLAYVPAERLAEGLILPFSVACNISLAGGQDVFASRWGIWRRALEEHVCRQFIKQLAIRTSGPSAPCATLSGGNQQKVVLAKWLCRRPRVIILDNPTRGMDAGAKEELYRLVRQLTGSGVCVVLITDELLELIGLSHRIAILCGGRLTEIFDAPPKRNPPSATLLA